MALMIRGMPVKRIVLLEVRKLRQRLSRPIYRASFYRRQDYRRQYWRALVRVHGLENEICPEYTKLHAQKVAESVNVSVPRLLAGPVSMDELNLDAYGNSFVIKPNWGTSSRGVLVLVREGTDTFRELIEGDTLSSQEVLEEVSRRISNSGRGSVSDLIVEESIAVGRQRPQEWKIFAFHGRVGLVQQIERQGDGIQIRLLSRDGADLGRLRSDVPINPRLTAPRNLTGLVDAAEKVSRSIATGFVRVDLFERESGEIVLGELCLIPGGDLYFRKGWDRKLGEMWDLADASILAERSLLIP